MTTPEVLHHSVLVTWVTLESAVHSRRRIAGDRGQVGIAAASWGAGDVAPTAEDQRTFEEAVRVAELQVGAFTGLEPPGDLPKVQAVRRGQWVQQNLEGLRDVLDAPKETRAGYEKRCAIDSMAFRSS